MGEKILGQERIKDIRLLRKELGNGAEKWTHKTFLVMKGHRKKNWEEKPYNKKIPSRGNKGKQKTMKVMSNIFGIYHYCSVKEYNLWNWTPW